DNMTIKPSRLIQKGDKISVRSGAFTFRYEVLQMTENRMAAKMVADFCGNITPEEELEKIKLHSLEMRALQYRGEGRPTKKDRRELDDFINS
ncbi:MAG: hypothetical protein WBB36_01710, partial [Chitinophagales bacterium]